VVDDGIEVGKLLAVMLQMNLFNAVPYTDPQAALEAARAQPPDYLISDIVMPGMSGIDLAIALHDEIPACKILLFSGQVGAPEPIAAAKDAGYDFALVQKPIHPLQLIGLLYS
jgi:DNA-binding NtrC family response regulator